LGALPAAQDMKEIEQDVMTQLSSPVPADTIMYEAVPMFPPQPDVSAIINRITSLGSVSLSVQGA